MSLIAALALAISATWLYGVIAFVLILCAMVVIHEFGHFIVAKMLGIAVETFSVGFGPRLAGFKIGDTDYRLSAIPLGGYVKFRGENMEMIQGKSEGSIDEFLAHPKWKRLLVAVAGPVFNIVTALAIPTIAILIGFRTSIYNSQQVVVGSVEPGSTAEQSGLQSGDRIIAYRDKRNPTWADFSDAVITNLGEDIPLTVQRGGETVNLNLRPRVEMRGKDKVGVVDLEPQISYIGVSKVRPDSPAARAGLQAGDKIIALNGTPVTGWQKFRRTIQEGQAATLDMQRGEQTLTTTITPEKKGEEYLLGIERRFETALVKTSSVAEAVQYGWDANMRILRLTGVLFGQIFAGQRSARDSVGGPLRIAEETVNTFDRFGWAGVIELMGLLSLNLGVFNLLPIPVLDGGVIMVIFLEWILGLIGLTLTMNVRERIQQVGFVMVLLLMGFVIINDFVGLGERLFSKPAAQQEQKAKPQEVAPPPTPAMPVIPIK